MGWDWRISGRSFQVPACAWFLLRYAFRHSLLFENLPNNGDGGRLSCL